ncbi:MAG: radical SAM protein, partial [Deltaproteobacteria bacterium]|nr:radical SAM protein [Deltaproteobacteria bacterium]
MRYEGVVYRPPSEGNSIIIQATVGCPHNRCAFCNMYKDKRFRVRKVEDILADIEEAGRIYDPRSARSLFLADGNTVIMRTEHLLRILRRIGEVFPALERVTSYGASQYISLKSPEEWKELRAAGLTRIHCGMESGHDPVLMRVHKGSDMCRHMESGLRVREAGMELSMYYMAGLGGLDMWRDHALDSARVLNAVNPDFIRVRTFTPIPGTVLGEEWVAGNFALPGPHAVLRELRLLMENLDCTGIFLSDHWLNFADVHGRLPGDKHRMLEALDKALTLPEDAFRPVGAIT